MRSRQSGCPSAEKYQPGTLACACQTPAAQTVLCAWPSAEQSFVYVFLLNKNEIQILAAFFFNSLTDMVITVVK